MQPDPKFLLKTAHTKMPFGKYQGRYLIDLPEPYLTWFRRQGFPKGQLGLMLQTIYEIKINGLDGMIRELQKRYPKPDSKYSK